VVELRMSRRECKKKRKKKKKMVRRRGERKD
jgi:hypothetical protein